MKGLNRKPDRPQGRGMKQTTPTFSKANRPALKKLAIAFVIVLFAAWVYSQASHYTYDAKLKVQLESTSHQLQQTKVKLQQTQTTNQQQVLEKQKQLKQVQQQLQETEKKLQAKLATPKVYAASAPVVQNTYPVPENEAKAFIYSHESGNNPGAINANGGACGLGQALPCSKMGCSLSDYACQDRFFTNYMLQRYGSWNNAKAFWVAHRWW